MPYTRYDKLAAECCDRFNKWCESLIKEHPFAPLIVEIDKLKQTLCELDVNDSHFPMRIEEHAKKLQDLMPQNPEDISCFMETVVLQDFDELFVCFCEDPDATFDIISPHPLCRLLSKETFHPKEIPLRILELLVTAGLDVNGTSYGKTSLHFAIDSGHYNAVRWLVEHGADCNAMNGDTTPISLLASRPNVPLDLFDLLKTPENFNDGTGKRLPLHEASYSGHINSALYLISLGAEVNTIAEGGGLPIQCYISSASRDKRRFEKFSEELFIKLLPRCCMDTVEDLRTIMSQNLGLNVTSKMVYPLLQRHINTGTPTPLSSAIYYSTRYRDFYLDSLLVLLLDLDVAEMPGDKMMRKIIEGGFKQAVIDIWMAYDRRHGKVKSLFKLCIQCTRKSMSSLDDDSFQSLPIPSKIRNSLMLWDIAEVICEALKLWPGKCIGVDDTVNTCQ